jgi:hypothetical protein
VPTTVTVTLGTLRVRAWLWAALDPPESVPTIVAPEATGAGADDVVDGALLGAVGEP